ncbi:MAG: hypothetical protein D6744_16940 [Planctomycetota bacterium]|nr:MAG: hypothetical protein D6744_16940 [Planctomycetota bacterium]
MWTLALLISHRWLPAGLIFGAALLVKPQAILFAPVLVFIIAAQRMRSGGSWRGLGGPIIATVVALAAAGVLSLPHTLAGVGENARPARSAAAGKPARAVSNWFDVVYGELVFGQSYPRTTFNAFNVWWFHYLSNYRNPASLDPTAPAALGLSKDALGKLMLAVMILAAWWLSGRKWGWSETSWLAVAALVTLAAFALPTRVHERYIYLCIPFFIALTALRPIWALALIPLLIVGTFEMTSFRWAGALQSAAVRNSSALLAALTCLALAVSLALLIRRVRPQSTPQS